MEWIYSGLLVVAIWLATMGTIYLLMRFAWFRVVCTVAAFGAMLWLYHYMLYGKYGWLHP